MMTAYWAWSMRRRSSSAGKELLDRSLGIARSRSPAWVVSVLPRLAVAKRGARLGVLVPLRADMGLGLGLFLERLPAHTTNEFEPIR
ncbi:hypothetical protein [Streptomyces europaeiscabiei]|uniref:hypothetical protein n=1 Tax=Streptomyces europaeiscabiei TaxID=146819 RepID=UPI00399A6B79